jgi:hypothetical protein
MSNAAGALYGKNVDYGLKSLTTSSTTPWGQLLNAGLTAGGMYLGGPVGGMIGSAVGSSITGSDNTNSMAQLINTLGSSGNQGGGAIGKWLNPSPTQSQILGYDTRMYM